MTKTKTKILLTTLTVATLAIGCGAFVACGGGDPEDPAGKTYEITFNANGGSYAEGAESVKLTTDKDGRLAAAPTADPTRAEYSFATYNTTADRSGSNVTYGVSGYQFKSDATVYAQWVEAGLYTADGKFVAELEYIAPGDSALNQYGAMGVELAPGDVLQIKVKGETLTHNAGTLELHLEGSSSHGVELDQSAATLTVLPGAERAFNIYAKYYTDNTPCWTISMTDGLKDEGELVLNGSYLCGQGWTNSNWDKAVSTNYIDPDNGLTLTFGEGAEFKLATCTDIDTAAREWSYNDKSYYKMADGKEEGYLDFSKVATGNGTVITPGEYTITIDNSGSKPVFVFTPAADLKPAELPDKYIEGGYYLAGSGIKNTDSASAEWKLNEGFYINPTDGLTVSFDKNAQFQVIIAKSTTNANSADWLGAASYYRMAEGAETGYIVLPSGGNGTVKTAGTYTFTIDNSGETPVFVITPAEGLEPDQTVEILHYYIKGSMHDSWNTPIADEYELKPVEGQDGVYQLTIELAAGVEFGFRSFAEDASGEVNPSQIDWFGGNLTLAEGVTEITKGNNLTTVSAGTYTFTLDPANKMLAVSFTPASTPDSEPEQPGPGTETENPAE